MAEKHVTQLYNYVRTYKGDRFPGHVKPICRFEIKHFGVKI